MWGDGTQHLWLMKPGRPNDDKLYFEIFFYHKVSRRLLHLWKGDFLAVKGPSCWLAAVPGPCVGRRRSLLQGSGADWQPGKNCHKWKKCWGALSHLPPGLSQSNPAFLQATSQNMDFTAQDTTFYVCISLPLQDCREIPLYFSTLQAMTLVYTDCKLYLQYTEQTTIHSALLAQLAASLCYSK